MNRVKWIVLLIVLIVLVNPILAEDMSADLFIQRDVEIEEGNKSGYDFKSDLKNTINKFKQGNIKVSHDDFKKLVDRYKNDDFYLIILAEKTARYGFFDISDYALEMVNNRNLVLYYNDDIRRFYFPNVKLTEEETIILAEAYSNIVYNDLKLETISELKKFHQLTNNNDYANYLIALGYHKVNNTALAQKHILLARLQNPTNINYKILHAEIISKGKNPNEGVKIINEVKKESLKISSLKRSVLAQEQLILYNMNTLPELKDYHLGHYYYLGREFPKSLRVLQGIQTKKNKLKSDVFGLMSRIYFENGDYEKSETYAQRALKIDNKQANALMSMGDIRFREGRYKSALRSYKRGVKYDSNLINSQIKLINVYDKLDMSKKQRELVVKLLKGDNISSELYYQKSKVVESQNEDFLIKSLSLDIENKESWISLVDLMLAEGDYAKAERYLSYIRYIDENDFRYYYYQGQVLLKKGDKAEAERHFNKSKKLNPDVVILKENK